MVFWQTPFLHRPGPPPAACGFGFPFFSRPPPLPSIGLWVEPALLLQKRAALSLSSSLCAAARGARSPPASCSPPPPRAAAPSISSPARCADASLFNHPSFFVSLSFPPPRPLPPSSLSLMPSCRLKEARACAAAARPRSAARRLLPLCWGSFGALQAGMQGRSGGQARGPFRCPFGLALPPPRRRRARRRRRASCAAGGLSKAAAAAALPFSPSKRYPSLSHVPQNHTQRITTIRFVSPLD